MPDATTDEKEKDIEAVLNGEEKIISDSVKEGKLWYKSRVIIVNILVWVGIAVQYIITYKVPLEEIVPVLIVTGVNIYLRTQTTEALVK